MRIALAEDVDTLDPARANPRNMMSSMVHKAVYQTLVTFPPDSYDQVVPWLASHWEIREDGLTYRFFLREGGKFSNGDPVSVDDVVFSFNRLMEVGPPSVLTETIGAVEKVDGSTVDLILTRQDPAILSKLATGAFSVINQSQLEENDEDWLDENSAGSGPYMIEEWIPGIQVILKRNSFSNEPVLNNAQRVTIQHTPDRHTQALMLETGDIDIAMDLPPNQAERLRNEFRKVWVHDALGARLVFLTANYNVANAGPATDRRVQLAIRHALDYETIRNVFIRDYHLWSPMTVTPASIIPVQFPGALEPDEGVKYDPEAARQLLDEAGYDGEKITLSYDGNSDSFRNLAVVVQGNLQEVGFDIELIAVDRAVPEPFYTFEADLGLFETGPSYLDALAYLKLLPGGSIGDFVGWPDGELAELREKALQEVNPDTRIEILAEIQRQTNQRGPYAIIAQPGVQVGLNANIGGFAYNPLWGADISTLSFDFCASCAIRCSNDCAHWKCRWCSTFCDGVNSCSQ